MINRLEWFFHFILLLSMPQKGAFAELLQSSFSFSYNVGIVLVPRLLFKDVPQYLRWVALVKITHISIYKHLYKFGRKKCWKVCKLLQYIANKVQKKVLSHEIFLTTQIIFLIHDYIYNHIRLRVQNLLLNGISFKQDI